MISPNIHDYIKSEENKFETDEIQPGDNWHWNFREHVQLIFHLVNGVFFTGENNWLRAFKQVMRPIIDLNNWTEDLEAKDVTFFIESRIGKVLSFLVKKYHDEVYVREHDLDTLFDQITNGDNTYGGVILQKGVKMPESLELNSIAFCDQTDILGGPIAFKHYFSPDKLRGMAKHGWGDERNGATISLDELCILASDEKDPVGTLNDKKNKVPGKTIEVYVVRGNLPEHYLKDNDNMEDYYNQIHVEAFYTNKESKKVGVTLYRKKENEGSLKFFSSSPIYQRALGSSVGESELHPQIWSNFLTIHKMDMLQAASKIPLQTDDQNFTNRNKIQDMENLEVTVLEEGKQIRQIPTAASANIQLFSNEINSWYEQAQLSGAAFDPLIGKEASSGTTFRGQERVVAQGKGTHDKKRGQRAKFIEEIYRDWIIPDIKKEILKGKKFLATLTTEELQWISEQLAINESNKIIKDAILNGKLVTKEEQAALIEVRRAALLKQGNKQLIEIVKGEFDDIEIKIGINVAGKQKDLVNLSDKLLSIFQFIFANPQGFQQAMQIPALAKGFENILEFGGMSIGDFSSLLQAPAQPMQIQQPQPTGQPQMINQPEPTQ